MQKRTYARSAWAIDGADLSGAIGCSGRVHARDRKWPLVDEITIIEQTQQKRVVFLNKIARCAVHINSHRE